ncbi:MAG: Asp-tRNA(Asn)/Glu-tRNA(Gln) amidotransferase subunit GatB [Candidatus Andersenbacteria bacterium]
MPRKKISHSAPLEPVIGLEIHVQLKTKSKMFCSCPNILGAAPPNSAICPICLGYPGTLPVPNATAIDWTLKAGAALNCVLATKSKFDRKSYFYPDLPKGYQISQYDEPFCGPGSLTITVGEQAHTVGITRIHLEEDAAKNIHPAAADYTLIDFNRAGTPLMEIVTEPDITTPAVAKVFLQELQLLMRALDIADADMEKGQLRCDANISLREVGSTKLYPKTEVKNLNSFRNVERALNYEIERQTKLWQKGKLPPEPGTRGFNAKTGVTTAQRTKEAAADYRYFPEPDIPPFIFNKEELQRVRRSLPELPAARRERFTRDLAVSPQTASLLVAQPLLSHFFENTVSELQQQAKERADFPGPLPQLVQLAANIIMRQIRDLMAVNELTEKDLKITAENFAELVILVEQGKVNRTSLTPLLQKMQETGGDPDPLIAQLGLAQESDISQLQQYVDEVIAANPEVVAKIKGGKETAVQFLMGQVMAKSKGIANPAVITMLLKQRLQET